MHKCVSYILRSKSNQNTIYSVLCIFKLKVILINQGDNNRANSPDNSSITLLMRGLAENFARKS
jgi:hypothetical protein